MNGKDLLLAPLVREWPDAAVGVMLRVIVLLALVTLALFGQNASAQSSTWTTNLQTNWSNTNAWVGNVIPTSSSSVFIGTGEPGSPFGPTLDVDATVNNLQLYRDGVINLNEGKTLTVNGSALLDGTTNVNLGTLTLNGTASNSGTISVQLSTTLVNGQPVFLGEGNINGSATLVNSGTIKGAGSITNNITNTGTINSTGLILSGDVQNTGGTIVGPGFLNLSGSTVTGGLIDDVKLVTQNGTVNGVTFGRTGDANSVDLTAGSQLTLGSSSAINRGFLNLQPGAAVNGSGTLFNESQAQISGTGTIATKLSNDGVITAQGAPSSSLVLKGLVFGGGSLVINSAAIVLDSAQVSNTIKADSGSNGSLAALNGASFSGKFDGTSQAIQLTSGSGLGIGSAENIQNSKLILNDSSKMTIANSLFNSGTMQLGNGAAGAIVDGAGSITNFGLLQGGGTISTAIHNSGTITANNLSTPLVLNGNIDNSSVGGGEMKVAAGATMILGNISVQTSSIDNQRQLVNGLGFTLVSGNFTQESTGLYSALLGGTGFGQYSQVDAAALYLGGTLEVNFASGFDAQSGDVFEIFQSNMQPIHGSFLTMDPLPTLDAGLYWNVDTESDAIFLDVLGTATGGGSGGGSGGGDNGGGGGSGGTVPEPSSIGLLVVGLAAMLGYGAKGKLSLREPA
jgi:hypothetical protein